MGGVDSMVEVGSTARGGIVVRWWLAEVGGGSMGNNPRTFKGVKAHKNLSILVWEGRVTWVVRVVFLFEGIFVFKTKIVTTLTAPVTSPPAPFAPKIPDCPGNVVAGVAGVAAATAVGSSNR